MINFKQFAEWISLNQFDGKTKIENEMRYIYKNILTYSYLTNIFSKKFQLNKSAKKTDLINNHSLKQNTKTKQLIQRYIKKQSYSSKFPTHRRAAIDYFQVFLYFRVVYSLSDSDR